MNNQWLSLFIFILSCTSEVALAKNQLNLQLVADTQKETASRLFTQTNEDKRHNTQQQTLSLKSQQHGLNLHIGLEGQQGNTISNEFNLEIYEGFYDFTINELDFSIGRKLMSSGVGYAYRPLDMVQQEERQTLIVQNIKGVDVLLSDYFTANGSLNLVLVKSDDGKTPALALKGYKMLNDLDLYWLIHNQQQSKTSFGFGFSWVYGDALEIHASTRLQGQYDSVPTFSYNVSSQQSQAVDSVEKNGEVTLLGVNWSHQNGLSLIVEYWHNSMAVSADNWQSIIKDKAFIDSGGTIDMSNAEQLSSLSQRIDYAFNQPNLQQNNIFIRIAYDSDWLDPKLDFFYHPDDGGYSVTLRAEHEINAKQQISFAWREYAGDTDSVMGQLAKHQQLSVQWEIFNAF
ncbi:MAG: hypothetical protein ISR69_06645 [Gammaproteobacteria bacterium]|nr:hypothetical protein [Gammaproteobacteria bacterium]